jgi:hypothetical protein
LPLEEALLDYTREEPAMLEIETMLGLVSTEHPSR